MILPLRNRSSSSVAMIVSPAADWKVSLEADLAGEAAIKATPRARSAAKATDTPQVTSPCIPSRNSVSATSRPSGARIRAEIYPAAPNDIIATNNKNTPATNQYTAEESRQVGALDTTERPIPAPKALRVNEVPTPATAPPSIADHLRWETGAPTGRSPSSLISAYPQEG